MALRSGFFDSAFFLLLSICTLPLPPPSPPIKLARKARTAARILASAARLVKPGGRLVYATCSLLPQENEAVAGAFTREHPDFEVLPVSALLAAAHVVDSDQLVAGEGGCFLRLWPHRHATDGFFAAVWTKKP